MASSGGQPFFADTQTTGEVAPIPVARAMTIDQLSQFISRGRSASACGARWPGMPPLACVGRYILTNKDRLDPLAENSWQFKEHPPDWYQGYLGDDRRPAQRRK